MRYTCITLGLFYIIVPGISFHSRVTGACPVTTDLFMPVSSARTTATHKKECLLRPIVWQKNLVAYLLNENVDPTGIYGG